MPLLYHEFESPGSRVVTRTIIYDWWFGVIETQAEMSGMPTADFGWCMCDGFRQSYETAIRQVPRDPRNSTQGFHQFQQVHSQMEASGLHAQIERAKLQVEIAKHFAWAYADQFNPSLFNG